MRSRLGSDMPPIAAVSFKVSMSAQRVNARNCFFFRFCGHESSFLSVFLVLFSPREAQEYDIDTIHLCWSFFYPFGLHVFGGRHLGVVQEPLHPRVLSMKTLGNRASSSPSRPGSQKNYLNFVWEAFLLLGKNSLDAKMRNLGPSIVRVLLFHVYIHTAV